MSFALVAWMVWTLLLGWAVATIFLGRRENALRWSLAVPVGVAVGGFLLFVSTLLGVPGLAWPAECALVVAGGLRWLPGPADGRAGPAPSAPRGASGMQRLVLLLGLVGLLAWALTFVHQSIAHPFGTGDAIDIWNLRARFLHRAEDWRLAFDPALAWSHADYPPLLPFSVLRSWRLVGGEAAAAGALVAASYTLALPCLLWALLRGRLPEPWPALAGLALLGTARLLHWGTAQYADVPLAFLILGTMGLLARQDVEARASASHLALAGLCAGFAATTKNEGQLFACIVFLSRLGVLRAHGWARMRRDLFWLLAGLALPLVVLLWFKLGIAPANDLLARTDGARPLENLLAPHRYLEVLETMGRALLALGNGLPVGVLVAVLLVPCARGPRRSGGFAPLLAYAGMLAGYAAVYVLLSPRLTWHLTTSLERLLLGIWPLAVFAAFWLRLGVQDASLSADSARSTA